MGWTYVPGMTEEELYHHGILGQKWGRRRYQNLDGSYTSAGRIRYGVLGSKQTRKLSKDAKNRAKERTRAKNEQAKQEALEAKTARVQAELRSEQAKRELREAKKENSFLGRKIAAVEQKHKSAKEMQELNKKPTRNEQKLIDAIQSGNTKKINAIAKQLNNDEYRRAINRVNMQYELDRAKDEAKIAKGRQVVQKLQNTTNVISGATDIYNATAGIVNAMGGNLPKVNTKYQDPLDRLQKQYLAESTKFMASKNEANAKKAWKELGVNVGSSESGSTSTSSDTKKTPNMYSGWDKQEATAYRNYELDKNWNMKTLTTSNVDLSTFKPTKDIKATTKKSIDKLMKDDNFDITKLPKDEQEEFWRIFASMKG